MLVMVAWNKTEQWINGFLAITGLISGWGPFWQKFWEVGCMFGKCWEVGGSPTSDFYLWKTVNHLLQTCIGNVMESRWIIHLRFVFWLVSGSPVSDLYLWKSVDHPLQTCMSEISLKCTRKSVDRHFRHQTIFSEHSAKISVYIRQSQ
jgi:hypothetical protein